MYTVHCTANTKQLQYDCTACTPLANVILLVNVHCTVNLSIVITAQCGAKCFFKLVTLVCHPLDAVWTFLSAKKYFF